MNPIVQKFLRSKWRETLLLAIMISYLIIPYIYFYFIKILSNENSGRIWDGLMLLSLSLGLVGLWYDVIRFHFWYRSVKGIESPVLPKWIRLHSDSFFGAGYSDSQFLSRIIFFGFVFSLVPIYILFSSLFDLVNYGWPNGCSLLMAFIYYFMIGALIVQSSYCRWVERKYCKYIQKSQLGIRYV